MFYKKLYNNVDDLVIKFLAIFENIKTDQNYGNIQNVNSESIRKSLPTHCISQSS